MKIKISELVWIGLIIILSGMAFQSGKNYQIDYEESHCISGNTTNHPRVQLSLSTILPRDKPLEIKKLNLTVFCNHSENITKV